MANFMPMGSYVVLNTPVHRTDARIKLFLLLAFSITVFMLDSWLGMTIYVLLIAFLVQLSHMPVKTLVRGIKPTTIILIFMLLANGLSTHAEIPLIGSFGIDPQGAVRGIFFILRIVLLVSATLIMTFSTSNSQLTEALGWLLGFLRPLKVPVDDLVTMLSIAIRFIPTTAEEFDKIVLAQKARGANFSQGNVFTRIKAWIPVFIPLFVNLFKRSVDLANAMDARCYRGQGRTTLALRKLSAKELLWSAGAIIVLIGVGIAL